jgi:hypothetical protein
MLQILLVGIGAGAASALLFVSLATGSPFAIALFYLAPLPIMLAGIGWSHLAALTAVVCAAGGLGLGAGLWFFLAHLVSIGIPAYILSYLAMLARHTASGADLEWYPVGHIVLAAAIIATITTSLTIPAFGFDIDTYRVTLKQIFERVLHAQLSIPVDQPLKFPSGAETGKTLELLVSIVPPTAAALSMMTSLINLWLAARIARFSGLLKRPWPDLLMLNFPGATPIVVLIAITISFLSSIVGLISGVLAACMLMAYAILGFSVVHAVTRTFTARGLILSAAWLMVIVLGWPIVILALIGLADGLFDLRGKIGPPNSNFPTNRPNI